MVAICSHCWCYHTCHHDCWLYPASSSVLLSRSGCLLVTIPLWETSIPGLKMPFPLQLVASCPSWPVESMFYPFLVVIQLLSMPMWHDDFVATDFSTLYILTAFRASIPLLQHITILGCCFQCHLYHLLLFSKLAHGDNPQSPMLLRGSNTPISLLVALRMLKSRCISLVPVHQSIHPSGESWYSTQIRPIFNLFYRAATYWLIVTCGWLRSNFWRWKQKNLPCLLLLPVACLLFYHHFSCITPYSNWPAKSKLIVDEIALTPDVYSYKLY